MSYESTIYNKAHFYPPVEEFPTDIPDNVKEIIIYRNKIKNIKVDKIYKNLNFLDISDNALKEVPSNLLEYFPNIEILDMSFNLYEKTPLLSSNTLKELYLHCNDILDYNKENKIETVIFDKLPNLEKIDLANNELNEIPIVKSESLKEYYISSNLIKEIKYENLEMNKNLTVLCIQSNLLETVDFKELPQSIESLLINGNKNLTKLLNTEYLPNLKYLDIGDTCIKKVDEVLETRVPNIWN